MTLIGFDGARDWLQAACNPKLGQINSSATGPGV
jgi:hypothetical protein